MAIFVYRVLRKMQHGRLSLVVDETIKTFGDPESDLEGTLVVDDASFFLDVVLRGEVGFGQAYVAGALKTSRSSCT